MDPVAHRTGTPNRARRPIESCEQAVAGSVDLAATKGAQLFAHGLVVQGQQLPPLAVSIAVARSVQGTQLPIRQNWARSPFGLKRVDLQSATWIDSKDWNQDYPASTRKEIAQL
jgi:hypothetical protein